MFMTSNSPNFLSATLSTYLFDSGNDPVCNCNQLYCWKTCVKHCLLYSVVYSDCYNSWLDIGWGYQ